MNQEHKILYKAIDEILWKEWDPIGVNDSEDARDEYSNYTPEVFRLKLGNGSKEEIAQYLHNVVTKKIGLEGNIEHCRIIAAKIILLSTYI